MLMVKTIQTKDKYIVPIADVGPMEAEILCQSGWGNEGLEEGDPWNLNP